MYYISFHIRRLDEVHICWHRCIDSALEISLDKWCQMPVLVCDSRSFKGDCFSIMKQSDVSNLLLPESTAEKVCHQQSLLSLELFPHHKMCQSAVIYSPTFPWGGQLQTKPDWSQCHWSQKEVQMTIVVEMPAGRLQGLQLGQLGEHIHMTLPFVHVGSCNQGKPLNH